MNKISEISIKIDNNGNVSTCYNANIEDLRKMTNALINHNDKVETKIFMTALSTILEVYKKVVLDKELNFSNN